MQHFDFFFGKRAKMPLPEGYEQILLLGAHTDHLDEGRTTASETTTKKVRVTFLGKEREYNAFHMYCIDIHHTTKGMISMQDELFFEMQECLDELVLLVDINGNIQKINNLAFVIERWSRTKKGLCQEYPDEGFQKLWSDQDAFVRDHDAVLAYVKSTEMYGLYFNGMWGSQEYGSVVSSVFAHKSKTEEVILAERNYFQFRESPEQQYLQIDIGGSLLQGRADFKTLKGRCQYVDGVLYQHVKNLEFSHKKITYSARWDGLRKRIQ